MAATFRDRVIDLCTIATLIVAATLLIGSRKEDRSEIRRTLPAPEVIDLSSLSLRDMDGRAMEPLEGRPALIFAFRSDCPACGFQRPSWLEAAAAADQHGYRVIGITSESPNEYVRTYFESSNVVILSGADPARVYGQLGATYVPTTILLGRAGAVLFHRTGVMSETDVERLIATIGEAERAIR
jgi:peroxiredoxin